MPAMRLAAAGLVLASVAAVGACGTAGRTTGDFTRPPRPGCLPALNVAPRSFHPDSIVKVFARRSVCGTRAYGSPGSYSIVLQVTTALKVYHLGAVKVGSDGSFTAAFRVPRDVRSGRGFITAEGWPCDDSGKGACASTYQVPIRVTP